ncbi:unnamed protein product [Boreogadus saida]
MLPSLKMLISLMITLLIFGILFTTLISDVRPAPPPVPLPPVLNIPSRGPLIEKVMARYSQTWKKQEENSTKFRDLLRSTCHGFTKAVVSQDNTPVGAQIVYDGDKRKQTVTSAFFNTFAKVLLDRIPPLPTTEQTLFSLMTTLLNFGIVFTTLISEVTFHVPRASFCRPGLVRRDP